MASRNPNTAFSCCLHNNQCYALIKMLWEDVGSSLSDFCAFAAFMAV
jgi:hypothetical protein